MPPRPSRIDVGQVMFGQTVTISSDVSRQFSARGQARPKKYAIIDGDSNGGGDRALRISRRQLSQRGAIRCRVGTVPAYRRSLARVLHHRSPERRAVHHLPRDIRAADGQGSAGSVVVASAGRGHGGDDAPVAQARIHAERDRDDDPRGPRQTAGPSQSRPSRLRRARRCRALSPRQGYCANVPRGGSRLQGRRSRRARWRGDAHSVWPRAAR